MSVTKIIEQLLEEGYEPAEIVRMGYAKSTVYTVYKRWVERKLREGIVYIAHDVEPEILGKIVEQLKLVGYKIYIGGNTSSTLSRITIAKAVIAILSRTLGYRRSLVREEIQRAIGEEKPLIILLEEGAVLPIQPPDSVVIIRYDRRDPEKTIRNIISMLVERKGKDPLYELILAIVIALVAVLGVIALVKILDLILGEEK